MMGRIGDPVRVAARVGRRSRSFLLPGRRAARSAGLSALASTWPETSAQLFVAMVLVAAAVEARSRHSGVRTGEQPAADLVRFLPLLSDSVIRIARPRRCRFLTSFRGPVRRLLPYRPGSRCWLCRRGRDARRRLRGSHCLAPDLGARRPPTSYASSPADSTSITASRGTSCEPEHACSPVRRRSCRVLIQLLIIGFVPSKAAKPAGQQVRRRPDGATAAPA